MSMTFLVNKVRSLVGENEKKTNRAAEFLANSNDIENIIEADFSIDNSGNAHSCYTYLSASAHRKSGPREARNCVDRKLDKSELLGLIAKLEK